MKYLIFFEKFNIQKEKPSIELRSDMQEFNNSEANIKEFNSKKDQLLQIYLNYTEDNNPIDGKMATDLYNKLLAGKFIQPGDKSKVIFTNPLFTQYAEYCRTQRNSTNAENNLANTKKNIDDINNNIENNIGDRQTNNDQLKVQQDNMKHNLKNLDDTNKNATISQKGSKKELTNKAKELTDSKKRITNNSKPTT